jgi:hypothetical protein
VGPNACQPPAAHRGVKVWFKRMRSEFHEFEEQTSPVLVKSSECRLTLENCVFSGMNESMNADSQIIHFSLTANPRPTVLKFGGDF